MRLTGPQSSMKKALPKIIWTHCHCERYSNTMELDTVSVPPTSTDLSIFIRIFVVYKDIRELCSIIWKSVRVVNYVIIV